MCVCVCVCVCMLFPHFSLLLFPLTTNAWISLSLSTSLPLSLPPSTSLLLSVCRSVCLLVCAYRTLEVNPNNTTALYQYADLLRYKLNKHKLASYLFQRRSQLQKLQELRKSVNSH
jgi:hypothetical protein